MALFHRRNLQHWRQRRQALPLLTPNRDIFKDVVTLQQALVTKERILCECCDTFWVLYSGFIMAHEDLKKLLFVQKMPKRCPKYDQRISKRCPKCVQNMPKTTNCYVMAGLKGLDTTADWLNPAVCWYLVATPHCDASVWYQRCKWSTQSATDLDKAQARLGQGTSKTKSKGPTRLHPLGGGEKGQLWNKGYDSADLWLGLDVCDASAALQTQNARVDLS